MRLLSVLSSPRPQSISTQIVETFLTAYRLRHPDMVVDTLNVWREPLPEFDADAIGTKYKAVASAPLSVAEQRVWADIRSLAARFTQADRIVMGVPMWNFSFPYKLKQLIDLSCQRNVLFTFDGERYAPMLDIDKAFVVYVRGQSDSAQVDGQLSPAFSHMSEYIEFWLRFIGVRETVSLTVEHTWDGRGTDAIAAAKARAADLADGF